MSALRKNTSSNFADLKNLEVADNIGAPKTLSFAFAVSEIGFELTDFTVQDATPVPLTSSTPMLNKEKRANNIYKTINSDTSKELLQIYTKELDNLCSERSNASEKIKELEKDTFLMKIYRRTM